MLENLSCYSHRKLRRPGSLRVAPVDAFQQHRELRTGQRNSPFRSLWPEEAALLQTLGEQTKAVSIEPKKFYDVTSPPAENKHVTGEWLLLQNRLHLGTQTIKATAHICYAGRKPDLRSSTKFDHLRRLSRIARSMAGSAPPSMLISARP